LKRMTSGVLLSSPLVVRLGAVVPAITFSSL
jgi:hypothetical protein